MECKQFVDLGTADGEDVRHRVLVDDGWHAFGDEWNDITMLEWAGRGVAMANADSRVQRAGNEITASNADDGVAVVLEELLA